MQGLLAESGNGSGPLILLPCRPTPELHASEGDDINRELKRAGDPVVDLLDSITESFIALDREWRFTYVNQCAVEAFGKPKDQIIGRKIWDLFPDAVRTEFYPQYQRVMNEGVPVEFEVCYPYPPNDLWFEVHAHPTDEGLSAYVLDITRRKLAEHKAQQNEQYFRALMENSTDGFALVDAEGRVVYLGNPILGYTAQERLGLRVVDMIHPDDRELAVRRMMAVREEPNATVTTEYRALHKNGSWRWVEATAKNLLSWPGVRAIVVTYRDVTHRKRDFGSANV